MASVCAVLKAKQQSGHGTLQAACSKAGALTRSARSRLDLFSSASFSLWIWLNDRDEPPLVCEVRPDLPGLARGAATNSVSVYHLVEFHVDVVPAQAEGCCRYTVLRAQCRTMRAAISCEVARYHSGCNCIPCSHHFNHASVQSCLARHAWCCSEQLWSHLGWHAFLSSKWVTATLNISL